MTIQQRIDDAELSPVADAVGADTVSAPVDGWVVNLADEASTVRSVIAGAARGESFSLVTLNVDHLVKLRESEPFREAYRAARFITADGAPVARIARRTDARIQRVTGADLFVPLCKAAAQAGVPVFLFGSSDPVLEATAQRLTEIAGPQLRIAGALSPSYGFDYAGAEADKALEQIRESGAGLIFVLLGAPKQELFAKRAVERNIPGAFACFGAAGDFVAGAQDRAPKWVQDAGFEAVWRFAQQPRRLGIRYLRCALLLARLEISALIGKR